ncbi:dihydrofolate reductase [Treponema porcinum]|uniref:dihydrofolate reductase n=1 Tax=Treponema porcinum TaxID=261392 RepID=UPI002355E5EF|nr:dihydrofolate reductase [Treponema porcinum]MCI5644138.1 dihydrofolate reductase [Treponema porcinum]MCI6481847.1 dihydrofolate reductase [Treponema porcinum]
MTAIIAAYTKNARVIGKNGKIPWNIPDDLKRFKRLTTGNAVIMGRKTFESIGKPLADRLNIVISRTKTFTGENCITVNSLERALEEAKERGFSTVFICGGETIYAEALPYCTTLYLTEIDADYDGDVFFPPVDEAQYDTVFSEHHKFFTYRTLQKRR